MNLDQLIFNSKGQHLMLALFANNTILYKKPYGFQENNATDHAVIKIIDQISNSVEKNHFTLVVFMDLSKEFERVDHVILIKKLDYSVKGRNLL